MTLSVKDATGTTRNLKSNDDGSLIVPTHALDFSQLRCTRFVQLSGQISAPVAITGTPGAGKRVQLWGHSYLLLTAGVDYVQPTDVFIANFIEGDDPAEVLQTNIWRAIDPAIWGDPSQFADPGNRVVSRGSPIVNPTANQEIGLHILILDENLANVTADRDVYLTIQTHWMAL